MRLYNWQLSLRLARQGTYAYTGQGTEFVAQCINFKINAFVVYYGGAIALDDGGNSATCTKVANEATDPQKHTKVLGCADLARDGMATSFMGNMPTPRPSCTRCVLSNPILIAGAWQLHYALHIFHALL